MNREGILELEQQLVEGIKKGDISLLDKILHDELLFLAPNGKVISKETDLASHRAGEMIVKQLTSSIEEIKIIDDTAVVTIVYDTKGIMLGNPIEGKFRYLRIWKQFPDGMKVIGGSCHKV
jgi:hypothetical protein